MNFKVIFLILLILSNIYAESDKLKLYSKISLKTLFYDINFKNKLYENNRVNFAIVYSDLNHKKAIDLKKYLIKSSKKFNNLNIEVILINENELNKLKDITCIYAFNINNKSLKNIITYAINNKIITFTSSYDDLKKGITILFDYQKEIEIFVNKKTIQKSNIEFKSTFLKAIKVFDDK